MKERPILFNDEMVRALLDGRKTQTRRVVKSQPSNGWSFETAEGAAMRLGYITSSHPKKGKFGAFIRREIHPGSGKCEHDIIPCPYGQPGDRLWVRETHGDEIRSVGGTPHEKIAYRATKPNAVRCYDCNGMEQPMKWRPSIHMPRSMARLLLEVTAVRVERLQDISREDAEAEGLKKWPHKADFAWGYEGGHEAGHGSPTGAFRALWESINGAGTWADNPWVWVVEFQRVDSEVPS